MRKNELFVKCVFSVLFGMGVYLVANFSFVASIFALIAVNIGLDYTFDQYIVVKRILMEKQYGNTFNSDYYDLYWWFNKTRLQVLLNIQMVILPLFGQIVKRADIFSEIAFDLLAVFAGLVVGIVICEVPYNSRVFRELIDLKKQKYSIYTTEEERVLSKLKQ